MQAAKAVFADLLEPSERQYRNPNPTRLMRRIEWGQGFCPAAGLPAGLFISDVVLTHGYFLLEGEKEPAIMRLYPPLGLLYISACLRCAGFSVEVFDSTLESREPLFDRLRRCSGILGIYKASGARYQFAPLLQTCR